MILDYIKILVVDSKLEKKIRRLGPTPLKVLEHIVNHRAPSSTTTISDLKLDKNAVGGGYSVLSRNHLVLEFGRDKKGSIRWEPSQEVDKNRTEILELINRLKR